MQLIAEFVEPVGAGSLQIAFEQLKARLQKEGFSLRIESGLCPPSRAALDCHFPNGRGHSRLSQCGAAQAWGAARAALPYPVQGRAPPWKLLRGCLFQPGAHCGRDRPGPRGRIARRSGPVQ